jgi:predicted DNA-binding protein
MGRPRSESGKRDKLLQIRLTGEELERLDDCAEKLNFTRSKAVRVALDLLEHEAEKE